MKRSLSASPLLGRESPVCRRPGLSKQDSPGASVGSCLDTPYPAHYNLTRFQDGEADQSSPSKQLNRRLRCSVARGL